MTLTRFSQRWRLTEAVWIQCRVFFFLCHSLLIPFSLSARWQMASPSPPGGSQSLWMRPHVNHRLSCDGSCQWRASHMGLASELVCNPPSPASEVPHGSLHAFGQGIAAAEAAASAAERRPSRVAGEEREVWEHKHSVSHAEASVQVVWMWCPPGERWCKQTRFAPSLSPTAEVGYSFPVNIRLIKYGSRFDLSLCWRMWCCERGIRDTG